MLQALTEEQAAIQIQAGVRGLLTRVALARQQEEEGRFLGMLVQVKTVPGRSLSGSSGLRPLPLVLQHAKHPMALQEGPSDALEMDASAAKERKRKQAAKQKLYDLQRVKLLRDIESEQGAAMREAVQDKVTLP